MAKSISGYSELQEYVWGTPTAGNTSRINFASYSQSGVLTANSKYRLACTENCFISFNKVDQAPVTNAGVPIFAGIPEVFETTTSGIWLNVIQATVSGTLYYTKMLRSDEF